MAKIEYGILTTGKSLIGTYCRFESASDSFDKREERELFEELNALSDKGWEVVSDSYDAHTNTHQIILRRQG